MLCILMKEKCTNNSVPKLTVSNGRKQVISRVLIAYHDEGRSDFKELLTTNAFLQRLCDGRNWRLWFGLTFCWILWVGLNFCHRTLPNHAANCRVCSGK